MKSALKEIPGKLAELFMANDKALEEAWANTGDDPLTLSISAKIGFDKDSKKPVCDVTLSFTVEKVKDHKTFAWDDHQLKLG